MKIKHIVGFCYEPQSLDKIIIKLFVNEFGKLPDSFRLA